MVPNTVTHVVVAVWSWEIPPLVFGDATPVFSHPHFVDDAVAACVIVVALLLPVGIFVFHNAVPAMIELVFEGLQQRDDDEHTSDDEAVTQRFCAFQFSAAFTIYREADDGDNRQYACKQERPYDGFLLIRGEGWVIDVLGVSDEAAALGGVRFVTYISH